MELIPRINKEGRKEEGEERMKHEKVGRKKRKSRKFDLQFILGSIKTKKKLSL